MSPSRDEARELNKQPKRGAKAPEKAPAPKTTGESLEQGAQAAPREPEAELPTPSTPAPAPAASEPAPAAYERKAASEGQLAIIKDAKMDPAIRSAWYAAMDSAVKNKTMVTIEQGPKAGQEVEAIHDRAVNKIKMGRLTDLTSLEASQAIRLLPETDHNPMDPISKRQIPVVNNILGHMVRSSSIEGAVNTFDNHVQASQPDIYEKLQGVGAEGLTYGEADTLIQLEKAFNLATKQERDAGRERMLAAPATEKQLVAVGEILEVHPDLNGKLPEGFITRRDTGKLLGADVEAVFNLDNARKKELVTSLVPRVKALSDDDLKGLAGLLSSRLEDKAGHTFKENFVNVQHDKLKALKEDPESKTFKDAFYDFAKYGNADALEYAVDQFAQM